MNIPVDETVHFDVVTHPPTTGAVSDADSVPTYAVFEEDTDTAIATGSLTKRGSIMGSYRGSFVASGASVDVGKFYSVIVTGTVNSIQGRTVALHFRAAPLEITEGMPRVDLAALSGNSTAAVNLRQAALGQYWGTVAASPTPTTTSFADSGLTQTLSGHWNGRIIIFITGTLARAATDITGFTPATDTVTFTALPAAPSAADSYVIV
jgi:hypothetical protein